MEATPAAYSMPVSAKPGTGRLPGHDRPLARLLAAARLASPERLVETLHEALTDVGARDVVLFLVDYDHTVLRPTPDRLPHGERPQPAAVTGTMAGRAFVSQEPLSAVRETGTQVWLPVTERADRLGVLAVTVPELSPPVLDRCEEVALAAGHLVQAADRYTDKFHLLRRRREMTLAAEMQWGLLPPVAFAFDSVSIAGLLEPAYEVGGDSFDYGLNRGVVDLVVFDAMGHGVTSSLLSSLAIGAYRTSRRTGASLLSTAAEIDATIVAHWHGEAFLTSLLAQLHVESGRFRWLSAGHPAPLLVRSGRVLPEPEWTPSPPLGLSNLPAPGATPATIAETHLEPGDRVLLYTDGVVDAENEQGEPFGEERLRDLVGRESQSGRLPSELLRRLVESSRAHRGGALRDDASLILLTWGGA